MAELTPEQIARAHAASLGGVERAEVTAKLDAAPFVPCAFCNLNAAECVGETVPSCAACCSHGTGTAPGPCVPIAAECVGETVPSCAACCSHGTGTAPGPCVPIALLSLSCREVLAQWYGRRQRPSDGALLAAVAEMQKAMEAHRGQETVRARAPAAAQRRPPRG